MLSAKVLLYQSKEHRRKYDTIVPFARFVRMQGTKVINTKVISKKSAELNKGTKLTKVPHNTCMHVVLYQANNNKQGCLIIIIYIIKGYLRNYGFEGDK